MKTIQVCIGLFLMAVVPFSCSDDDIGIEPEPIDEIASGETVLELQLEAYALDVDTAILNQRREELLVILEEDPDNDNASGELEDIDDQLSIVGERLGVVTEMIAGFGLGPIPIPPPCKPLPDFNCPFIFGNFNKLLIGRQVIDDFRFEIIDPETEDLLFVFEEFSNSELNENLLESPFNVETGEFPEEFIVNVSKIENGQDVSYTFFGTF